MKKIRFGIFGYSRGESFVKYILANNGEVVAVCDKREDRLEKAKQKLGDMVTCYTDFEAFATHDMDAVLLTNYFHEHAQYAISFLERNIHVLSECTSNATMAEGVKLVEAAEKSKALYMLAENYPFMTFNREMKRIYDGGSLGKCLYAEGEYNHAGSAYAASEDERNRKRLLFDSEKHWRNLVPRTYYVTHSLAPIMYATGANPVRVTAMPVFAPVPSDCDSAGYVGEKAAIITTLNDDDSVFKVTGHASFGASDNSYRLCCEKGQVENVRGSGGKIMLRYNGWDKPEDAEAVNYYQPEDTDKDAAMIKLSSHGGGDFLVIRKFMECVRENKRPDFDVYFATRMASVAILAHRSLMEFGVPYDIPDFRKKEDREKYRNDDATPFHYSDGREPNIPCCSRPDYKPSEQQIANFNEILNN